MANKGNEITLAVTVRPGMSMWDAIKLRIAGEGSKVLWDALAKKITDEKGLPHKVEITDAALVENEKLRELLSEFVSLCAVGDVDEAIETHGWSDLIARTKMALRPPKPGGTDET